MCEWRTLNISRKCVDVFDVLMDARTFQHRRRTNYGKFTTNNKFMPLHSIKFHYFHNLRPMGPLVDGVDGIDATNTHTWWNYEHKLIVVPGDKCATLTELHTVNVAGNLSEIAKSPPVEHGRADRLPGSERMFIALPPWFITVSFCLLTGKALFAYCIGNGFLPAQCYTAGPVYDYDFCIFLCRARMAECIAGPNVSVLLLTERLQHLTISVAVDVLWIPWKCLLALHVVPTVEKKAAAQSEK